MTKMKSAVAYARVSTEEQAERNTIESQLSACREWCKSQGAAVIAEFTDAGVSGTTPFDERPGGAALLAAADQFDTVVIYAVDRLTRDTIEGGGLGPVAG